VGLVVVRKTQRAQEGKTYYSRQSRGRKPDAREEG
jgi:hypothetical protein